MTVELIPPKTGQIRGLLCRSCNLMLGNAQEEVSTLASAIKYLEEYNDD